MRRWEYTTVTMRVGMGAHHDPDPSKEINRLGKEGWELISFYGDRAYFKRELVDQKVKKDKAS